MKIVSKHFIHCEKRRVPHRVSLRAGSHRRCGMCGEGPGTKNYNCNSIHVKFAVVFIEVLLNFFWLIT